MYESAEQARLTLILYQKVHYCGMDCMTFIRRDGSTGQCFIKNTLTDSKEQLFLR